MRTLLYVFGESPPLARWTLLALALIGLALMLASALLRLPNDGPARQRMRRVAAALGVVGAALLCIGALAFTQAAGRTTPTGATGSGRALAGDTLGRLLVGTLVAVCMPCAALLATRDRPWRDRLAHLGLTLPLALAGLAVAQDVVAELAVISDSNGDASTRIDELRHFALHLGLLTDAAHAVPIVAGLSLAVALAASWKLETSSLRLGGSVAVLALGALAFVGTRDLASDARHTIPFDYQRPNEEWPPPAVMRRRNPALPCFDPEIGPLLSLADATPSLDGRSVDVDHLADGLHLLVRNWSVLHSRDPFPGMLQVVRGPGERTLPIAAALAIARDAGFSTFRERVYTDTAFATHTRGVIQLRAVCMQDVEPF